MAKCTAPVTGTHSSINARRMCPVHGQGMGPRPDPRPRFIRDSLATSPSTPPGVLAGLAGDQDELVRKAVADNPSTPAEALGQLAKDESDYVQSAAVASARAWMCENLGVEPDNEAALEALIDMHWWELTADDEALEMVLAVHRNR